MANRGNNGTRRINAESDPPSTPTPTGVVYLEASMTPAPPSASPLSPSPQFNYAPLNYLGEYHRRKLAFPLEPWFHDKCSGIETTNIFHSFLIILSVRMSDKLSPENQIHNHQCGTHVYHGHRAQSFYITSGNDPELVEIRARQRTFDGAAYRTAMGNLSYAIVILKLFDARFYRTYLRSQRSKHDFADIHQPTPVPGAPASVANQNKALGRAFKTAGWSVITIFAVVIAVEIALLLLILEI
ncbi:hypothetical protein Clacol_008283 [Clathrus columnatus]|uniref:Uncharacterized protein n=1 Tax=Clathrus columnatus TaxID=1419009 RepID=A0AAV5AHA3_9AGAM|nr:hypothetical protein Clacol_008283 [Clathrus columnatus]